MEVFLKPRSVALVGVPRKERPGAYVTLLNLLESFDGDVYPVNPHASEILGVKAYRSIKDVPADVDLTVISTKRELVPQMVEECVEKGVHGVIIVTQGFAEADAEGQALQEEIVRTAKAGGVRVLGPNTMGVLNAFNGFSTTFGSLHGVPLQERRMPVAIVSQTGFFVLGVGELFPGKFVDLGNMCDVDFVDALEYFEKDEETELIILHMEGLHGKDGRRFLEAVMRVARRKPILVLKTGRSEKGAELAASHTGAMTGNYRVYTAALRQAGAFVVSDIDELQDFTKAFLRLPPLRGAGVAVITYAGAAGVMVADVVEECGLRLSELSTETIARIQRWMPAWMQVRNPVDIWVGAMAHGPSKVYEDVIRAVLCDEDVAALLCIYFAPMTEGHAKIDVSDVIKEVAAEFEKPVVVWLYGYPSAEYVRKLERGRNVAVFPTIRRAVQALAFLNAVSSRLGSH
ncbi:MAG: Acyl-CoA synthetase [Candidatus Alkanophagales archaeon MCA70_species_2]|nr:Acyl-CoA synthetase [Candidatus Alkanophaga liquidiphilum]